MPKVNPKLITADDLYRFEVITDFDLSPDGKHIVYCLNQVNRKTEKKYSNLFVVPVKGGKPRQFTFGENSENYPRWSPDGKLIAFYSNRENKEYQIYILPFAGGEARKLTSMKGSFGRFIWSPDGKKLVTIFQKKDPDEIERDQDEAKKKLGVVARHYTETYFKWDGEGYQRHERNHFWTIDTRTGKASQLTSDNRYEENQHIISRDGQQILFFSNRSDDPDFKLEELHLWSMSIKGGKPKQLTKHVGSKSLPEFSPCGKWIAYSGKDGKEWHKTSNVWMTRADGKVHDLRMTINTDYMVGNDTINDIIGAAGGNPVTWSNDGEYIYFQASWHGNTLLKRVYLKEKKVEDVISFKGVLGKFFLTPDNSKVVYYKGTLSEPGQLVVHDLNSGRERQLTHVNKWLANKDLGAIEEVWFKGKDKNDLHGWILKPPRFNPRKKYPSILEIHGGPMCQYGNLFMHEFYYLAAAGYVVYFCNPRSSTCYGEEHAKGMYDWGGIDYDDVMKWTDYMVRQKYIDKNKLGVTGGSYGGFLVNWIIGHTHRFAGAVTQRSVSNIISKWGSSDYSWGIQKEFGDKPPWENVDYMWERSPVAHLGKAKTPTLIIHSENDMRCSIEQGEQVYIALKYQGVDTEMVRFPESSHGLSRGGRTDRRIARLHHIKRWFDKYL